jgi:hypothetical protein
MPRFNTGRKGSNISSDIAIPVNPNRKMPGLFNSARCQAGALGILFEM